MEIKYKTHNENSGKTIKVIKADDGREWGYEYQDGKLVDELKYPEAVAKAVGQRRHDSTQVEYWDFKRMDSRIQGYTPDDDTRMGFSETMLDEDSAGLIGDIANRVKNGRLDRDTEVTIKGETYTAGEIADMASEVSDRGNQLFNYDVK